MARWRRSVGFTLVEVLVALFVLSVAIAGAALAQLAAQRTLHEAARMTDASLLAGTLAGQVQAHAARANGHRGDPYLRLDYDAARDGAPTPPAASCFDADCSAAELADFDLYEAMRVVHASLPGGRVRVCRDARPFDEAAGALGWHCTDDAAAPVVVKVGWRGPSGTSGARPALALAVHP